MPAIDFPAAPAVNDEYSFEGRTWRWNGTGWEVKAFVAPAGATGATGVIGVSGATGAIGVTGATGPAGPTALAAGSATGPSLYFTGDDNTGLYSPGADQVAISTGGTERARIDSSGRLLVGTSTARSSWGITPYVQYEGSNSSTYRAISHTYNENSVAGPLFFLAKSRGTSNGSNTVLQADDELGQILFAGADGIGMPNGARIQAFVDGTPGANDMPGRLVFSTTADGASSPTERLRITSAGNVGIGTTSPAGLIHGRAAAGAVGLLLDGNTGDSNTSPPVIDFRGNAGAGQGARIAAINTGAGFGRLDLAFFTSNTGSDTYTPAERARIDSSGRLLVGTSTARSSFFNTNIYSPFVQFESANAENPGRFLSLVYGKNDASGPILILGKHRSNSIGGHTVVQSEDEAGQISFQASDGTEFVEVANIFATVDGTPGANDMPGRLVFSTTADGAASPTARMRISSSGEQTFFTTANDTCVRAKSTAASGATVNVFAGFHSATGFDDGTNSFLVRVNGNVLNTNNSYGALSDIKLKENIVDAPSQWSDIKALQVRKYNFKEETGQETHTQIGLVAQEAELVSPGLVSESPDLDAEGNHLGTVTKSVNYSVLYMKAVKALQEAMERIETLEAKVAALEAA